MLKFVREIQTRGIHRNWIFLLVPQSWRVWTSIITICSSSRCFCIYIFFKSSLQLSHWPGSESAPPGSKDEVVKVEVKEEKQEKEKPPVQTLEKDAAIFSFWKQGASHVQEVSPYFVYSFWKQKRKQRKMRHGNPAARFQLYAHGNNLWGDRRKSVDHVSDVSELSSNQSTIKTQNRILWILRNLTAPDPGSDQMHFYKAGWQMWMFCWVKFHWED